ncbi:Protein of unknown function [Streptococcus thermophilus]|nr:Protein of unknown function [Streptococcus thermophilus]
MKKQKLLLLVVLVCEGIIVILVG